MADTPKNVETEEEPMTQQELELFQRVWDDLDILEESHTVEMGNDINLSVNILRKSITHHLSFATDDHVSVLNGSIQDLRSEKIDPSYEGPRYESVLDASACEKLFHYVLQGNLLPRVYCIDIVRDATAILKSRNTVQDITVEEKERAIVVGDLHGQLGDLRSIIEREGLPSASTHYLFNGDFVDRGDRSVEVVLCLYLLLVMTPHRVNLNRGNHECDRLNAKYGFQAEATKKIDFNWFELVQESFRYLPLCHVLNDSVLVVHGGLFSEEVDLDRLRKIDRTKDLPRSRDVDNEEKSLIMSMLWSDPRELEEGMRSMKSKRGCGVHFGEQVTKEFLDKSGLSLIVRSHEVCNEGTRKQHGGKLITLFSASHYTGSNTNWGAFLTFSRKVNENGEVEGSELVFCSTTYTSEGKGVFSYLPKSAKESGVPVTAHLMKREALGHLKQIIYQKRHTLLKWFTAADSDHNNHLPMGVFIEGLQTALNLSDFPWKELVSYIATVENDEVDYIRFLRRYQIKMSEGFKGTWMSKVTLKICREISLQEKSLAASFQKMDKNGDGVLDYIELVDCLKTSGLGLTDSQLFDIIRCLDQDADGQVDYEEFVGALGSSHEKAIAETEKVWKVNSELDRLREDVVDRKMNLRELFLSRFKDEEIQQKEFKHLKISKKSFKKILKKIDVKGRLDADKIEAVTARAFRKREKMSFHRFSTVFTPRTKSPYWQEELIQNVCSLLLSTRMHLRSLFTMLDEDNSGNLDLQEFKQSMAMINEQLGFPLSDVQVENLHTAIDVDGDGFIRFEEFLDTLQVIDTEEEKK